MWLVWFSAFLYFSVVFAVSSRILRSSLQNWQNNAWLDLHFLLDVATSVWERNWSYLCASLSRPLPCHTVQFAGYHWSFVSAHWSVWLRALTPNGCWCSTSYAMSRLQSSSSSSTWVSRCRKRRNKARLETGIHMKCLQEPPQI